MSTDNAIRIRLAVPGEAHELTRLVIRSKRSNGYDQQFMDHCTEELAITEECLKPGAGTKEFWVAESETVHGCACLEINLDSKQGVVSSFFVDPEKHRQGIGKLLWQKIIERAKKAFMIEIVLDADPAAVNFYQAMGFTTVGEKPSGSIPGRMLPHMRLRLERVKG